MSKTDRGLGRRDLLAGAGRLSIAGTLGAAYAASGLGARAAASPPPDAAERIEIGAEAMASAVNDALEGAYGVNAGLRRNHTKGIGALGHFVGRPEAGAYSRSALFSGERIEVVARFSLAGGDPTSSDAEKTPRGLGLEFRLPNGGLHHMTMIHTPMFFAAVPATFLDKFNALTPDPATGAPDPARFRAFMARHPDINGQVRFLDERNPPPSYANCAFFGIHTFRFLDRAGKVTLVRFRFEPRDGELRLSDAELKASPPDFLEAALAQRLRKGPALWDLILTIGEPGDVQDDPTVLWPDGRPEVNAGTLTITAAAPDREAGSFAINFDPLMLSDGVEATNDPVLLFRSSSYAISHTRRLQGV
jgi:catalase